MSLRRHAEEGKRARVSEVLLCWLINLIFFFLAPFDELSFDRLFNPHYVREDGSIQVNAGLHLCPPPWRAHTYPVGIRGPKI